MNLADASGVEGLESRITGRMLVCFDVLGGRFELNFGALEGGKGEVCYFGPDVLSWMPLGFGFSAFVQWSTTKALARFSENLRWRGWEAEVAALRLHEALHVYPPPFTTEGRDVGAAGRRAVPLDELFGFYADAAEQLGDVKDGEFVRFTVGRPPRN